MSDNNVIDLPVITKLDLPPERIIARAAEAKLQEVVVIGFDVDGDFWFSSSQADGGAVLWLLEIAKKRLLEIGDPK